MKRLVVLLPLVALASLSLCLGFVYGASTLPKPMKLVRNYYKVHNTCVAAEAYVRHQVKLLWDKDNSITPKLLRLLYSDCFVTGCDASVLLDVPNSERAAPQNRGLAGFVVIDRIKDVLEKRCTGVVSCADILVLATRDALHLAGAPSYPVYTGRKDGFTSTAASVDLPSPSISWEQSLNYFTSKGLDVLDMATLLGAHGMGRTHCRFIEDRLYDFNGTKEPDPTMEKSFLNEMRNLCPPRTRKAQSDPLVYLNPESGSSFKFTKTYYQRTLENKAVLHVDQQLLYGYDTKEITEEFAAGFEDFRRSFALSMNRMSNINVLTGNGQGEVRKKCSMVNKKY